MISFILLWFSCQEKSVPQGVDPTPTDSGIIIAPAEPSDEDTAIEDTATEDTAVVDSGIDTAIEDTAIEDTAIEDTAIEDTAVVDSGIDTAEDTGTSIIGTQMPDFTLPDTNPFSSSYGATISVRDQLQSISGWYFIKAT